MKKLLKSRWFWVIVFVSVVLVFSCVNCLSCGTSCRCNNCETIDLTQDFTKDEIKAWKKENRKNENKHLLNGGYYIHFKGENYPVVFTEGKITRFDNMPDELFFYDMFELFIDSKCKHRCAFRGEYCEYDSIFNKDYLDDCWTGYIFRGSRPKNGTILYFDEGSERKFSVNDEGTLFGPDDIIPLPQSSFSTLISYIEKGVDEILLITDSSGNLLEEYNTIRKLYYWARAKGLTFNKKTKCIDIPYPAFLSYEDETQTYYWYSNVIGSRFKNRELKNKINNAHMVLNLSFSTLFSSNSYRVKVEWSDSYSYYDVCVDEEAEIALETRIASNSSYYRNIVRNDDGKIVSYVQGTTQYSMWCNVFYGTLLEFNNYLIQERSPIDEENKTSISYYSFGQGTSGDHKSDFGELVKVLNNCVLYKYLYPLHENQLPSFVIHAVRGSYKTVTLHGDIDSEVNIFKNKEYVLPTTLQKGGYEFKGWYKTSDFKGAAIEKIAYDDDFTELFAKFDKVDHYTLSFEPFNGQTFDDIIYSYGDEVLLPVLSKAFHAFKGWCTDSALTSQPMKIITEDFSGSYRLYPCFEPIEFSITIIDSDAVTEVKVKYGEESYSLPIDSVKDGFLGYYDAYGVQYTDETGKSLNPFTDGADIQLFAKYKTEDD